MQMREVLKKLDTDQIEFICKERKITEDELFSVAEDALYDDVYDVMCAIECVETLSNDVPLTDYCQMAADLVTILGNML